MIKLGSKNTLKILIKSVKLGLNNPRYWRIIAIDERREQKTKRYQATTTSKISKTKCFYK